MATKIRANRFGYAVSEVLARIGGMKTMSRVIRAVGVILAIGLSLAGCANSGGVQGDTPPPPLDEVKRELVRNRGRYWKDPYSIRDASIGPIYSCFGWAGCACLELNAKNSYGGYGGLKQLIVNISSRGIADIRDRHAGDTCVFLAPFPELNGTEAK